MLIVSFGHPMIAKISRPSGHVSLPSNLSTATAALERFCIASHLFLTEVSSFDTAKQHDVEVVASVSLLHDVLPFVHCFVCAQLSQRVQLSRVEVRASNEWNSSEYSLNVRIRNRLYDASAGHGSHLEARKLSIREDECRPGGKPAYERLHLAGFFGSVW